MKKAGGSESVKGRRGGRVSLALKRNAKSQTGRGGQQGTKMVLGELH